MPVANQSSFDVREGSPNLGAHALLLLALINKLSTSTSHCSGSWHVA